MFKSASAITKSVQFSLQVIKLFEQYEVNDANTRNAMIDTLVAVLQSHKVASAT